MFRSLVTIAAVAALAVACRTACDARPPPACCGRPLYTAPPPHARIWPYRTLDRITVSCPPLNPKRCEQLLRERACELDADVLVTHTYTLVGRRGAAQITKEAELVRFESKSH